MNGNTRRGHATQALASNMVFYCDTLDRSYCSRKRLLVNMICLKHDEKNGWWCLFWLAIHYKSCGSTFLFNACSVINKIHDKLIRGMVEAKAIPSLSCVCISTPFLNLCERELSFLRNEVCAHHMWCGFLEWYEWLRVAIKHCVVCWRLCCVSCFCVGSFSAINLVSSMCQQSQISTVLSCCCLLCIFSVLSLECCTNSPSYQGFHANQSICL